ncbi:MAG: hypothetical protein ACI8ZM_005357 [Crocinitomix sp.]|jgi:hypothetical protein
MLGRFFLQGMNFIEDIFIPQFLLFLISIIFYVIFVSKYSQTTKSFYNNLSLIPLLVIATILIRDIQMLVHFAGKDLFPWAKCFDLMYFAFLIFFYLYSFLLSTGFIKGFSKKW